MNLLRRLWRDKRGFLATTDLILLATIVVLGSIVGLVAFRNQVVQEFGDMSMAVGSLNQSYQYTGYGPQGSTTENWAAGSTYVDNSDYGEDGDPAGAEPAGISVRAGALTSESGTVTPTP